MKDLTANQIVIGDGHTIGNGGGDNLHITSSSGENIIIQASGGINALWGESSEHMRIDSSGNVGIGTRNPNTKLTLEDGDIKLQRTDLGNSKIIFSNAAADMWAIAGDADGDFSIERRVKATNAFINRVLTIESVTSEAMRIDSAGNVGIGTTDPSQKLEVAGHLFVNDGQGVFIRNGTSGPLYAEQEGSGPAGVFVGGNVGIGTRAPNQKLSIEGTEAGTNLVANNPDASIKIRNISDTDGNFASLDFYNSTNYMTARIGAEFIDAGDRDTALYFATRKNGGNLTRQMVIDEDGKVGINATDPISLLSVFSTGASSSVMRIARSTSADNQSNYLFNITEESDNHSTLDMQAANGISAIRLRTSGASYFNGGNVGIGTTDPSSKLHIEEDTDQGVALFKSNSTAASAVTTIAIESPSATSNGRTRIGADGDDLFFNTSNGALDPNSSVERMRITSDGALRLTGGLSAAQGGSDYGSQFVQWCDNNGHANIAAYDIFFKTGPNQNRTNAMFISDGGKVGIGTSDPFYSLSVEETVNAACYVSITSSTTGNAALLLGDSSNKSIGRITYNNSSDSLSFRTNGIDRVVIDNIGNLSPFTDNARDLGKITNRWDDIYATNGTIQTSDRQDKQDIEELTEAETRVAQACKGLLRKYRWKDAVAEKDDEARIHFGIIAQDLEDAFTAEGLDAGRYGMFVKNTWWTADVVIPAVEAVEAVYEQELVQEATEAVYEDVVIEEATEATEAVIEKQLVQEAQEAVYEDVVIEEATEDTEAVIEKRLVQEATEAVYKEVLITPAVEAQPETTENKIFENQDEAPEGAVEVTQRGVRYSELLAFIIAAL
tara:strand:+ start:14982 stop:17492 length:2511 start_codon:yes stop_codon:yes gene_type:complete